MKNLLMLLLALALGAAGYAYGLVSGRTTIEVKDPDS